MKEDETHRQASQHVENLLTIEEIAQRLRVHIVTVREYLRKGRLKGTFLGKRAGYRVKESDLDDFLTRNSTGESSNARSSLPVLEPGEEYELSPEDREFFERITNLPPANRRLLEGMTNMLSDSDIPEEAKVAFTEGIKAHLRTIQVMKGNKPSPFSS